MIEALRKVIKRTHYPLEVMLSPPLDDQDVAGAGSRFSAAQAPRGHKLENG